jgi:hypothetical protein
MLVSARRSCDLTIPAIRSGFAQDSLRRFRQISASGQDQQIGEDGNKEDRRGKREDRMSRERVSVRSPLAAPNACDYHLRPYDAPLTDCCLCPRFGR